MRLCLPVFLRLAGGAIYHLLMSPISPLALCRVMTELRDMIHLTLFLPSHCAGI